MSEEQSGGPEAAGDSEQSGNPIKEMFLLAVLYLPLGFFLWFTFASAWMFLPSVLFEAILTTLFADTFEGLVQLGFYYEVETRIFDQVEGKLAVIEPTLNPMLYSWGMALVFGLAMATPLTKMQRLVQITISYFVLTLVTVWGVFWELWKDLAFNAGSPGATVVAESIFTHTSIALCYQLGYLILPAVTPVALWILMNRSFLEKVVFRRPY